LALHRRNKEHKISYPLLLLRNHLKRNSQERLRLARVPECSFRFYGLKRSRNS
jgi:hypothetical protein